MNKINAQFEEQHKYQKSNILQLKWLFLNIKKKERSPNLKTNQKNVLTHNNREMNKAILSIVMNQEIKLL